MKVKINNTWLARGERESVADLQINGRRIIQIAQLLRADEIKMFDRKNHQTTVSFSVSRLHSSVQASECFILEHSTGLPGQGLVTFVATDDNGRDVERHLQAACIEIDESRYIGRSTHHTYTVIGGKMLKQKP